MKCEMYERPDGEAEYDVAYIYHHEDGGISEWRATHQNLCRGCAGDVIMGLEPSRLIRIDRLPEGEE